MQDFINERRVCGKLESQQVLKLANHVEGLTIQLSASKLPNEIEKNKRILTKTSPSVPRTNPFSEALFGVDNVVLFSYVQFTLLPVVKILHGGHKTLAAAVTNHDDLLTCAVG